MESRVKKISFKKKKELENSLIKEFNISRELKDTNMGFAIEKKRERERERKGKQHNYLLKSRFCMINA